ncbi:uncharacterized protein LOC110672304 isoform X2 [Hevea brasiliensis]|uniref:uncharacterized protein LOC110672304 isoform X2 n=1 Tax=Hevea brasiliensis TaxID=3981 RepID=UPI002600CF73|nr:uncharacterized protein LOC110672304 isoform X2 [Hevea brasiliensis]
MEFLEGLRHEVPVSRQKILANPLSFLGRMRFNDDEQIFIPQDSAVVPGRVQLISINNNMVPLEESKLRVMLEITGRDSSHDRPGLDLVAVLDVSGNMAGAKIAKAKTAMLFMIKKLSSIDRFSLVTFSGDAIRLCPLRQISENSRKELENLINGLKASGNTNITAGLQTGLKVINDRSLRRGRSVGIMLLSDGEQNTGGDAAQVPIGKVPVHTFGFGKNHQSKILRRMIFCSCSCLSASLSLYFYPGLPAAALRPVLKAIADNSIEGTFSEVQNTANLSIAFSQCLAGLLTRVVEDLKLTITRCGDESKIQQVIAGSYPQSKNDTTGSRTVTFGSLYAKEVRKVIVDLLLSPAEQERGAGVLEISYSYRFQGKTFQAPPAILTVCRTRKSADQQERSEVKIEETRLLTASTIKEAREMADINELRNARYMLFESHISLEDADVESNPLVKMLKSEQQQLLQLMKSQKIYEKQGRPFALSSETSHDRQRFAARGDVESLRLFATPRMDKYLKQAKSFDEDPSKPLPSVDEDEKEELAANPLAPIAGAISFYLQLAMKSLQAIEKIIN